MNNEYDALFCPVDIHHNIDPDQTICLDCGAEIVSMPEDEFLERYKDG